MANKKITELNAATSLAATDVVPVVDVSADETKKITATNLFRTLPDGTAAAPSLSFASDAANGLFLASSDTVGIATGGTQRVTVDGSGNVSISGDLTVSGATTTVESTTVTIDDKNIELGSVASPSNTTADGGGITLKGATDKTIKWINSTGYWTFNTGIEVEGYVQVDDNYGLRIGTGQDLKIFHDGTHNYIKADNGNIIIKNATSDFFEGVASTGVVNVKHNGTTKLATRSDGVNVIGELECDSLDVDGNIDIHATRISYSTSNEAFKFLDGIKSVYGNGDDLQIYHDGSASYIADNGTGNLNIQTNGGGVVLTKGSSENLAKFIVDGAVELYHDNAKKLETKSDGVDITGELQCDSLDVDGSAAISSNVGIGTSSPSFSSFGSNTGGIHIQDVGSSSNALKLQSGSNIFHIAASASKNFIFGSTNHPLGVSTNGTERLSITADGKIGMGTQSPAYNLSVESTSGTSINIKAGTSSTARLRFGDSGDDDIGQIIYDNGGNSMRFHTNASEALRIDSVGNVGIGTSSVAGKLHVFKGNGARNDYSTSADGLVIESSSDTGISIDPGAGNTANIYFPNTANHSIGQISHDLSTGELNLRAATYLRFSGSSNTELMRLDSSGRLLLGTTTEGSGFADNFTVADSGHSGITIRSGTSSHGSIYFSDGTSGGAEYRGYLLYDHAGDHLAFGTGAVERFRITSTGAWSIEGANNYGTSGQVLTSNGNDAPTWQDAGAASVGGASAINMNDSIAVTFGASNDLAIYHNGTHSYVKEEGTGELRLGSNNAVRITKHDSETLATFTADGSVDLYYDNSKKFETKSDGIDVTGEVQCDSLDVDGDSSLSGDVDFIGDSYNAVWDKSEDRLKFNDNAKAVFGTGVDLRIYHDGSNSRIDNELGSLIIKNNANDQDIILTTDNGSGSTTTYVKCNGSNGQVDLTHYGSTKFSTKSDGIDVTGEVQCDSLDVDGGGDFTGGVNFRGGVGAVDVKAGSDIRLESGGWTGDSAGKIQHHGDWLYVQGGSNGIIFRHSNGSNRVRIDSSGHLRPDANNTYDLGRSDYRWRNVYTNDLNLSNEGHSNDVDGTWGSYTIQEGEDDLFLINRRNGKKYKFNLTEVS